MAITVQLYEDSGAVISAHGTTRNVVNNIGWKSSPLDETNLFTFYPIIRPTTDPFAYSYTKYNYFKISGTYTKATRPYIIIKSSLASNNIKLFYKLTSTYAASTNSWIGDLIYVEDGELHIYPKLSTIGPEDNANTSSYVQYLAANTTYYTQYIQTQLLVTPDSYQNISPPMIGLYLDEYEGADT